MITSGSAESDVLHVPVRVRAEAHSGQHEVVVDYSQGPKPHPVWVIVIREAESAIRIKPAMLRVTALIRFPNSLHETLCHMKPYVENAEFLTQHSQKARSPRMGNTMVPCPRPGTLLA